MSKSKAPEIVLSDSDDDMGVASSSKAKPKASTSSVPKKRAPKIEDSDSDAMAVDVKPKKKSPAKPTTVAKKRKSKVVDSDASVTSTDEEDVKPKKARVAVAKPGTKPALKKAKVEEDLDDEDVKGKGKGKAKAPLAEKPKVEKDEKPAEKPKWTFKAKTGPANPGEFSDRASCSAPSRALTLTWLASAFAGSKDIPAGEDNCLTGLTFVFTGELESLSREAGQDLAKRYGG